MSCNCLDAGLVRAQFLEESVICLQIQHASALPVGQWRRRFRIENVHQLILDVQIHHVGIRIVDVRIVRLVWRIVAGKNQIGIVIVAVVNDNIWFFCRAIFGDNLHVCFMIRPRVDVWLLIGCGEIIVHPILAAIVAIVHIWYDIFVARFGDDVAKVEIAVGIESVHENISIVVGRWLIALIVFVVAIRAATRAHEHFIIVGNLQIQWILWRILMIG